MGHHGLRAWSRRLWPRSRALSTLEPSPRCTVTIPPALAPPGALGSYESWMALRNTQGIAITWLGVGSRHAAAVSDIGDVYVWGEYMANNHYQSISNVPRVARTLRPYHAVSVACGERVTFVSTACGRVFSFGGNAKGALGTPDCSPVVPAYIPNADDVRLVPSLPPLWLRTDSSLMSLSVILEWIIIVARVDGTSSDSNTSIVVDCDLG